MKVRTTNSGGYATKINWVERPLMIKTELYLPLRVYNQYKRSCFKCRRKRRTRCKESFNFSICVLFICVDTNNSYFIDLRKDVLRPGKYFL